MRTCAKCGADLPLESGRGRRRKMCQTCSPSKPRKSNNPAQISDVAAAPVGSVLAATRAALTRSGGLGTPMGQAALVLAARIDDANEPLAAITQATKQLAATLTPMAQPAAETSDPNDEFTRKRLAREHGA